MQLLKEKKKNNLEFLHVGEEYLPGIECLSVVQHHLLQQEHPINNITDIRHNPLMSSGHFLNVFKISHNI